MGFEKAASGTTAESAQENFMRKNFAMSNGYLRTIPFRDVEYLPVTCSHTFAALNIIDGSNIRGIHEKLCTNGYVDQQKPFSFASLGGSRCEKAFHALSSGGNWRWLALNYPGSFLGRETNRTMSTRKKQRFSSC